MKIITVLLLGLTLCACNATGGSSSSNPPDSFLDKELGALRHTGHSSGYNFSLRKFTKVIEGNGTKSSWKKENDQKWIYRLSAHDQATGKSDELTLVIQLDGNLASVNRFITNGKEVNGQYVGNAFDVYAGVVHSAIEQEKLK